MKEDDIREVFGSNVCSVDMPVGLHGRFREISLWNMEINLFIQRTLSQHKSKSMLKRLIKDEWRAASVYHSVPACLA